MFPSEMLRHAETVLQQLRARRMTLATAESCTGGWVGQCLTAIAGSSGWFDRGFITYSNDAKIEILGVSADALAAHGAVSEAIAAAMALGANSILSAKGSSFALFIAFGS